MKDFRDLLVWQKSHALALRVYRFAGTLPNIEQFGLSSQLRRSVVSISANIAEGCCRQGDREFAKFLYIAMGSASELECLLLLSRDLEYLEAAQHKQLNEETNEVKRMLASLINRLTKNQRP